MRLNEDDFAGAALFVAMVMGTLVFIILGLVWMGVLE